MGRAALARSARATDPRRQRRHALGRDPAGRARDGPGIAAISRAAQGRGDPRGQRARRLSPFLRRLAETHRRAHFIAPRRPRRGPLSSALACPPANRAFAPSDPAPRRPASTGKTSVGRGTRVRPLRGHPRGRTGVRGRVTTPSPSTSTMPPPQAVAVRPPRRERLAHRAMAMRMMCDGYLLESASLGSPGIEKLSWLKPVFPGDVLHMRSRCSNRGRWRAGRPVGLVTLAHEVLNQHDQVVLSMEGIGFVRRREPARDSVAALGRRDFVGRPTPRPSGARRGSRGLTMRGPLRPGGALARAGRTRRHASRSGRSKRKRSDEPGTRDRRQGGPGRCTVAGRTTRWR